MARTLLVPVDGSEHSRRALTVAATEFDADELVVLHVVEPFDVFAVTEEALWDEAYMEKREQEAESLLEEYEALADDLGITIQTAIGRGSPPREIVRAIDEYGADHVVMGSRGRTGVGRVVLGSVAETVAERAPVSVTIVRPER